MNCVNSPQVSYSLSYTQDFSWVIHYFGRQLLQVNNNADCYACMYACSLLDVLINTTRRSASHSTKRDVLEVLRRLAHSKPCCGNPDPKFHILILIKDYFIHQQVCGFLSFCNCFENFFWFMRQCHSSAGIITWFYHNTSHKLCSLL